jgi:hypothetical protein
VENNNIFKNLEEKKVPQSKYIHLSKLGDGTNGRSGELISEGDEKLMNKSPNERIQLLNLKAKANNIKLDLNIHSQPALDNNNPHDSSFEDGSD